MIRFVESGMSFEFDENNCFRIELDDLVSKQSYHNSSQNIKACECVTVIDGNHCFIEAKSSAPRKPFAKVNELTLHGQSIPKNWEAYDNYQKFLRDISKKFIDSFSLLKSITEGRHGIERMESLPLYSKYLSLDQIRFILIVNLNTSKNVDKQSMSLLKDAITNEMRPFLKIWNIPDKSVKVALPGDAKRLLRIPIIENKQNFQEH